MFYPESTLIDASYNELVDCWSDCPTVLQELRELLPFGQVLPSGRFEDFVDLNLPNIAKSAQEQLLYWHLSEATALNNHPVETLLLWNSDDYFWFTHIPP